MLVSYVLKSLGVYVFSVDDLGVGVEPRTYLWVYDLGLGVGGLSTRSRTMG